MVACKWDCAETIFGSLVLYHSLSWLWSSLSATDALLHIHVTAYWMPRLWMPWDIALCGGVAQRLPRRGGLIKCQFPISVSKQWTVHCPAEPHRLSGYSSQKPPATLHPPRAQFCLYCISKARCLRMCWAEGSCCLGDEWMVSHLPVLFHALLQG